MSTMEILLYLGLGAYVMVVQLGRHTLTPRRLILPLAVSAAVAWKFLPGIPTAGGDLDFELALTAAGAALGVLAASLVGMERDAASGAIVTRAGVGYALVWAVVLGGRLAFGYAASHWIGRQLGEFSIAHAITGAGAWTAAFVLMAIAMVAARSATLAVRALLLAPAGRRFLPRQFAA